MERVLISACLPGSAADNAMEYELLITTKFIEVQN